MVIYGIILGGSGVKVIESVLFLQPLQSQTTSKSKLLKTPQTLYIALSRKAKKSPRNK